MTFKIGNLFLARLLGLSLMIGALEASAAVPQVLNHQGRVSVGGENFHGSGQFKFALVNGDGTTSYWSNDGTSNGEHGEPSGYVTLEVNKGLYSVLLGDVALANMTVIPLEALDNDGVHLRVWFSDGSHGFQHFSPDQRLAATPYAVQAVEATGFSGSLVGDVTGPQGATAISASTVTGKFLTGYVSGAGTLSPSDSILTAVNKLNGNDALKADLASPTFTGTVNGITKSMVGLGNVSNTTDANKPISTAQQTALNLKASLASPTFTGTVNGITKSMVGLGNVDNTSDADKPVSTAQQTALGLRAPLESPTFTGTVLFPAGSTTSAPLQLAAGSSLTEPVFGSVEFDGDQLYLTGNAGNPTRRALAFADGQASSVELSTITAAPLKPVVAWGENDQGQTTVPTLSSAQSIAAGASHSLALLDEGTVLAWGGNGSGQATVPAGLTAVTAVAAGSNHNLALKVDGTVVAWGDDSYGQATVPAGITTATQVAAGEKHSLVLLADGTLRVWGNNNFNQLTVPDALTGVTVTAIAAGYDHSLALTEAGTVIAWGRSDADQLEVPDGLSGVTAIAAGAYHCLALKDDGTVVAWGWNNADQSSVPDGLSGVSRISAGYGFSMALKSDGTIVPWGDNSNQQTQIPATATQVISIAAGSNHALALRADAIPAQVARLDQDNVFTGKVGIGRTPATNALEVAGNASKSTAGSWLSNSDRRIKAEVESIAGALETLDQVRLVDFRYTEDYLAAHPEIEDRRYPNVIAQEFAQVFPDDVKGSGQRLPDGSEILQVDTYPLTIYSAAAVQELHQQNKELKAQLADQEQRLRKLEEILKNK
jgi:alpha-tubulin suppressor-like RCC1 family protein